MYNASRSFQDSINSHYDKSILPSANWLGHFVILTTTRVFLCLAASVDFRLIYSHSTVAVVDWLIDCVLRSFVGIDNTQDISLYWKQSLSNTITMRSRFQIALFLWLSVLSFWMSSGLDAAQVTSLSTTHDESVIVSVEELTRPLDRRLRAKGTPVDALADTEDASSFKSIPVRRLDEETKKSKEKGFPRLDVIIPSVTVGLFAMCLFGVVCYLPRVEGHHGG
jgi:hypothetical protein